jgi:hypothetical protein
VYIRKRDLWDLRVHDLAHAHNYNIVYTFSRYTEWL